VYVDFGFVVEIDFDDWLLDLVLGVGVLFDMGIYFFILV